MSRRRLFSRGANSHGVSLAGRARGFTLIELMIALVLGLIVVAGVVSVFLANQRSYRTNQALGDVQDGSRVAFEMMARDIRNAGLTGCGNGGRVANVLTNSPGGGGTLAWWADWTNAVHGYDGVTGDTTLATGTATTQRKTGTDSLQLLSAADSSVAITSDNQAGAQFTLSQVSPNLQTGDVAIVCDPDHATIFQISDYDGATTVTYATGGTPGNCAIGLGFPSTCTGTGNSYTFLPNALISKLSIANWYIGYNTTGGLSLFRSQSAGGTPAPAPQEMVRDVSAMTLAYHQTGATTFVAASAIANWSLVDAVQTTLTVQSVDQRAGTDVKPISRQFTATTTLRNRVQ
jgi:type IV pilus assembly protein PilW